MDPQIKYRAGYKYQLADDYALMVPEALVPKVSIIGNYIALTSKGKLIIRAGYAWDGASGPTLDTRSSMRGSLVHDALYQLMRRSLVPSELRESVDDLFFDICKQDGMWSWRAWMWHIGVRNFAGFAAKLRSEPETLTAP